jgi:branched-subunit amino acid permease
MILLAEIAPLAGRLAFAAVFFGLIIWLILMPKRLLDEGGSSSVVPVWKRTRAWAVLIALLQMLVYLLWK